jgi:hypothetical protein
VIGTGAAPVERVRGCGASTPPAAGHGDPLQR